LQGGRKHGKPEKSKSIFLASFNGLPVFGLEGGKKRIRIDFEINKLTLKTEPTEKCPKSSVVAGLEAKGRMLSRLSARSGLLADFCRVLEGGGVDRPTEIRRIILEDNVLGRPTSSARSKLFKELRSRYLLNAEHPLFIAFLEEWSSAGHLEERDLLVFVLLALNDLTVMTITCEWLFPRLRGPNLQLRVEDLKIYLAQLGRTSHPEVSHWSPSTLARVAQHYLATIRDCGMARGTIKKVAHRPALYSSPVRLLIKALRLANVPITDLVRHEAFKIAGIAPFEVVDVLTELNRQGSLSFRMQADVVELKL